MPRKQPLCHTHALYHLHTRDATRLSLKTLYNFVTIVRPVEGRHRSKCEEERYEEKMLAIYFFESFRFYFCAPQGLKADENMEISTAINREHKNRHQRG